MSLPVDLNPVGGLTLHDLLQELEDIQDDRLNDANVVNIAIMPPNNACHEFTDEDSGEPDLVSVNNLPLTQLLANAEINNINLSESDSDSDPEYNIPLARLERKNIHPRKAHKWKNGDIHKQDISWPMKQTAVTNRTPYELFSMFFDEDIVSMILEYTNLYSAQRNNHTQITTSEIKKFFGILLLSGYNHVSRRRMYWETVLDTHNKLVADALSRDKFEFILSHIHCNDNLNLDQRDKYSKVRPLFNKLNSKSLEHVPHLEHQSVDESMIPYFGRHSCKQFIKGKPIRYGYKFWVGATDKGYTAWFEPYQGANSVINENYRQFGLGPSVVLSYADVLLSLGSFPFHIFSDNFFTTVPLLDILAEKGIRGTGTIPENRMSKCPLQNKKLTKKERRGYFEHKVTEDNRIVIGTCNDNNIVNMASNAENVTPSKKVQRYSQKEKKKISIDQPALFSVYNAHMGGVDRGDQNISLYIVGIRGKKWYFPLICHCLDMCVQNAWQIHRNEGGKLDHLTFRRIIVLVLLQSENKICVKRSCFSCLEKIDTRYDRMDHFITSQEKQTRCRVCHKKVSTKCEKCDAALHINCFICYHTH